MRRRRKATDYTAGALTSSEYEPQCVIVKLGERIVAIGNQQLAFQSLCQLCSLMMTLRRRCTDFTVLLFSTALRMCTCGEKNTRKTACEKYASSSECVRAMSART